MKHITRIMLEFVVLANEHAEEHRLLPYSKHRLSQLDFVIMLDDCTNFVNNDLLSQLQHV